MQIVLMYFVETTHSLFQMVEKQMFINVLQLELWLEGGGILNVAHIANPFLNKKIRR